MAAEFANIITNYLAPMDAPPGIGREVPQCQAGMSFAPNTAGAGRTSAEAEGAEGQGEPQAISQAATPRTRGYSTAGGSRTTWRTMTKTTEELKRELAALDGQQPQEPVAPLAADDLDQIRRIFAQMRLTPEEIEADEDERVAQENAVRKACPEFGAGQSWFAAIQHGVSER
jgi:hypothetical protein